MFWSCSETDDPAILTDSFDREAMLANWADNIIIPGYISYNTTLDKLTTSAENFTTQPSEQTLSDLRLNWQEAYISWQRISMFEIGKAEQLSLRDFTNIYPTQVELIETAISTNDYNLTLPSSRVQQGFPAIDYLINGMGTDTDIIQTYSENQSYSTYLLAVVNRLNNLGTEVLTDWQNGYRDTFVSLSGSDANSSVNKLVNDFMFYYEKSLRAGKVGIPAGIFSNTPLSDRIESLYSPEFSKTLLQEALSASDAFFNGVTASGEDTNYGLSDYLDYVNALSEGESLNSLINQQFDAAALAIEALDENLMLQIETDNALMLKAYDELQKNVILMKVDMFQALNIKVDFVDADGD